MRHACLCCMNTSRGQGSRECGLCSADSVRPWIGPWTRVEFLAQKSGQNACVVVVVFRRRSGRRIQGCALCLCRYLVNHLEPTQVLTMLRAAHGMMPWPRPPACRARIFEFWSWRRVIVTFIPYLGGPRGLLLKLPIMATSSVWHHLSPFQ